MKLSPLDIQHMEFHSAVSGYRRKQVREFLERVADEREELLREMQALRDELAKKDARLAELQTNEAELKHAVIAAERIGNELKENARLEAALIVREAEQRRTALLQKAETDLERLRAQATRLEREQRLFREQFRGILDAYSRSLAELPLGEGDDAPPQAPQAPNAPEISEIGGTAGGAEGDAGDRDDDRDPGAAERPREKAGATG